jgi:hypothetical protein
LHVETPIFCGGKRKRMNREEKARIRSKEWRKKNPDRYREYLRAYGKKWRAEHAAKGLCNRCVNKVKKGEKSCKACKAYNRQQTRINGSTIKLIRKKDHGAVLKALKDPKIHCAICKRKTPNGKGWCVDHCHSSKKFRGILCSSCNLGLGILGESVKNLKTAIMYLERMR